MSRLIHLLDYLVCQVTIRPFMRVTHLPQPPSIDLEKPCLFILAKAYASDELALKCCVKQLGIEQNEHLVVPPVDKRKANARFTRELRQVYENNPNIQLVPVNVFWGRSPGKVKTLLQAWLADSWAVPGMIKRRLIVMTQMRQVVCYFGQDMGFHYLLGDPKEPECIDRRHRLLSDQFRKQKEAVIGPDLSHRRVLAREILESTAVQACIRELAVQGKGSTEKLSKDARKYIREMAADYSYTVVRLFDRVLGWLWEKLYCGVDVRGMEHVRDVAEDCQLIYVPCHRSHIDYLLLSYVVFKNGLMPPHIAAGINLNLPVLGGFLRRAGAFFIRRQFRDNKLYRAVLESYIGTMCEKGVPIEYFIEGGRSRTGFLLPAKAGMLAMTMRAAQDQQVRPLAFIPVYFGYERLLESHSYINELYGEKKQRESLFDLFSARRYLKENYGRVFVSFGSAVRADDIWQSLAVDDYPRPADGELFVAAVDRLGQSIQTQVNNIASLSALNLVATALLGSKRSALLEGQLIQQLDLLRALVKVPVYLANIVLESCSNKQAIEYAFSLGLLRRNRHALGDILYLDQKAQIGATFLRNNSLHVFILPSLVASILINTRRASLRLIQTVCYRFYPYLQAEYFLPWEREGLVAVIEHAIAIFSDAGLVHKVNDYYCCQVSDSEQYHALMVLAGGSRGSLERFYITARLVTSRTEGYYDRTELEQACVQMAERLSLLHEFHAPDFFDKNLFSIFISSLIGEKIFNEDSSGKLSYGSAFLKAKKLDKYVLSPSVRRSIRHITSADQ